MTLTAASTSSSAKKGHAQRAGSLVADGDSELAALPIEPLPSSLTPVMFFSTSPFKVGEQRQYGPGQRESERQLQASHAMRSSTSRPPLYAIIPLAKHLDQSKPLKPPSASLLHYA